MYSASGNLLGPRATAYYQKKNAKRAQKATVTIIPKRKAYAPRLKSEYKSIDVTNIALAQDTTGTVTLLNGCQLGSDLQNREGRQINLRSFEFKGRTSVTSGTGVDQVHRIMLVLDKNPNGVAPAITDILLSASTSAPRNLSNRKRFKIIMDKRIAMNATAKPGAVRVIKKYKRMVIPVMFNANNNGNVTDIVDGALFMVGIGTEVAGNTAGSTVGVSRVRFTE